MERALVSEKLTHFLAGRNVIFWFYEELSVTSWNCWYLEQTFGEFINTVYYCRVLVESPIKCLKIPLHSVSKFMRTYATSLKPPNHFDIFSILNEF